MNRGMLDAVGNDNDSAPQEVINHLAELIRERRLTTAAIFILEMYRPLASVIFNIGIISYPLLIPLFGSDKYSDVVKVMRSRENIERLICALEVRATEESSQI